jgi:predicted PurR-regulated permease PerM
MRGVSSFAPIRAFLKHKRAVNAVISNIILIAAVLIVGFTTLFWSQYQSSTYQMQYTDDINSEIGQLQEKVVFEYVVPVGGNLRVYLLNCGKQNVTIREAFVNSQRNITNIELRRFDGTLTINNTLHIGEQAYFTIALSGSSPYLVKIITGRDSTFVGSS